MALPNGDLITTPFDPQMAYPSDRRMQVDTLNSRDSISMFIRWEGMTVYVLEDSKIYILQGGRSNEYWKELGTGTGTGGTTFVGQFESADLLPTSGRSAGDYAFVGTGDDFVQYNWDNIANEWVMAEGQTDMASEFFHIGYKTPLRRPVIFQLFRKDVLVETSGDFVFAPETSVARFIFTGEVEAIRGIETAAADTEIKLVNRTGSDIPLRDKASGIPSGSGMDFGGTDYTWVNGSEITLKGNGTYWELAPNNQVAFSDHLDSVNAKVSVGSDGLEVISNFFNSKTKQIQSVRQVLKYADGSDMSDVKADGYIYFKVGTKYFVDADYKATGIVNVKKFGAVHDYVSSGECSDNYDAFSAAISFMKSVSAHSARSRKSAPVLLIPKGDEGTGYGCSGDLDFGGGYSVIMEAPLYKIGAVSPSSDAFVTIGESSNSERITDVNLQYNLWIRSGISLSTMWTGTEKYAGIEVKNIARTRVNIKETVGFEVGQRFIGRNAGFSYNKLRVMNSLNNRVHIKIDSFSPLGDSSGYNTSNAIEIGRVGNDSTSSLINLDRYGIVIDGTGYTPESLTFKDGVIEGLLHTDTPSGVEGIPVLIRKGNNNKFLDFRHESNSQTFMRVESGSDNDATLTIAVPIGSLGQYDLEDNDFLEVSGGSNLGNIVKTRKSYSFKGDNASKIIYQSGDLASRTVAYNDSSVHVAGMARVSGSGTLSINHSGGQIIDGYLLIPNGNGMGIEIDTSKAKRIIVDAQEHPDHYCRCFYYAYDSSGNVLPSSNIQGELTSTVTTFGANGKADFYNGYNRRIARFITLSESVHKLRIIFQGINNPDGVNLGGWIKSFNVISVDGLPSAGNVIQYNYPFNYAIKAPTFGDYVKGKFILNYDFMANPSTFGWLATSSGIGASANWKEIKSADNSVSNTGATLLTTDGTQLTGTPSNGSITKTTITSSSIGYPVIFGDAHTYNGATYQRSYSVLKDRDSPSLFVQSYDIDGLGQGWVLFGERAAKSIGSLDYILVTEDFYRYLIFTPATPGTATIQQNVYKAGDVLEGEIEGGAKTFIAGAGVTLRYPDGQGLVAPTGSRFIIKFKSPNDALVTIIKPYASATTFNQLADTPAAKTGNKNKTVKVSNDETTHVYVADGVDVRNITDGGSIAPTLTDGFIGSRLNFTSSTAVTLQGFTSAGGQSSLTLVNPHATNNLTLVHNGSGTVKYIDAGATDLVIAPKTAVKVEIVGNEIYRVL